MHTKTSAQKCDLRILVGLIIIIDLHTEATLSQLLGGLQRSSTAFPLSVGSEDTIPGVAGGIGFEPKKTRDYRSIDI